MSIDEIDAAYSHGGETTRMTMVMSVDEIAETYGRGDTESQHRETTPTANPESQHLSLLFTYSARAVI